MRSLKLYLIDIHEAMSDILEFTNEQDKDTFLIDKKTSSAVIMKLEVIGEACKSIPNNIRDKYHTIPWKEMAGMRDRLIHAYFGVDLNLVWNTIKNRIPRLKNEISKIILEIE